MAMNVVSAIRLMVRSDSVGLRLSLLHSSAHHAYSSMVVAIESAKACAIGCSFHGSAPRTVVAEQRSNVPRTNARVFRCFIFFEAPAGGRSRVSLFGEAQSGAK